MREQLAGGCVGSDGRVQWSMVLRGAAVALTTLVVAAFAFAARADALPVGIYWANANTNTIGFATGDAAIVDNSFIHVSGGSPNGVAAYGDFIYWTVPNNNAIGRAGQNGTGVNQTFIENLGGVEGVAVNSNGIFWTNPATGSIGRANLDGTGVNPDFITGASPSNLMAADSGNLYWTISGQFSSSIARADVTGDNLDPGFISSGAGLTSPEGVAVDNAHIYWTDLLSQNIGRANVADGSAPNGSFIGGAHNPTGIAVNDGQLYWSNFITGKIGTADADGNNVNQSFLPAFGPEGVAAEPLQPGPIQPPPKIADLIAKVTGAGLPHGIENSLLAKLENAQRKVDGGQIAVACNGLDAYLNEVRAQNGKKLQANYAKDLIATALGVQDALGCGTT